MSTVLGNNNLSLMDKLVYEAFVAGYSERTNMWNRFFTQMSPTRMNEKFTIIKLDNDVTETTDGGAFTPSNILEIGGKTVTQRIFKDSVTIGDFAEAFDDMGKIKQAASQKGTDYKYKMDLLAADFLNNHSSSTGRYGFIVDGTSTKTSLSSATQPIGNTGATQSNLQTGGWSKTNLVSARTLLREMKGHNGNIAGYTPAKVVCPVELTQSVYEDIVSKLGPTADNNANYVNSLGLEIIEWDLLTTATTSFLIANYAGKFYVYCIKQAPSVKRIRNQNTDNEEYQFKMMLEAGITDYQGTVAITA